MTAKPNRVRRLERRLDQANHTLNPWPALNERYDAAKSANLGDQLRPEEITERVRVELENAFAAGALWQYGRRRPLSASSEQPELP